MGLLTPSNLKTVRFELKGLDEYLAKIAAAGNNIETVIREALPESSKPIYDDMVIWAKNHKLTGDTLEGVTFSEVQQDGNRFYVEVGIDAEQNPNAWHAVFVEYGSPTNEADPGIRRAFEDNKARVKRIQREIFKQRGTPVD